MSEIIEIKDNHSNPWKVIDETNVYENNWIQLSHFNVITPGGSNGIYGKVHFKNIAAGVVPIDSEGYTYLVGQFRFTTNSYSWEIPEGGAPIEEGVLKAAQRELLEETGLKADNWQEISIAYLSNSVSDEIAHLFIATGLTKHQAEPEETEQLIVKRIPLKAAFEMVDNGEILDAMSIIALQKVQLILLNGKLIY